MADITHAELEWEKEWLQRFWTACSSQVPEKLRPFLKDTTIWMLNDLELGTGAEDIIKSEKRMLSWGATRDTQLNTVFTVDFENQRLVVTADRTAVHTRTNVPYKSYTVIVIEKKLGTPEEKIDFVQQPAMAMKLAYLSAMASAAEGPSSSKKKKKTKDDWSWLSSKIHTAEGRPAPEVKKKHKSRCTIM